MSSAGSSKFIQQCPWCARTLHIPVQYLDRQVDCRHCKGRFVARDRESSHYSASDSGLSLLRRADEMLELAQLRPPRSQQ